MAKRHSNTRIPKVRIARPAKRQYQLRYTDPATKKEIRIAIGTRDEAEAERQRAELLAKLTLGIDVTRKAKAEPETGPNMPWDDFREQYRNLWLNLQRDRTAKDYESRLDVVTRILKPRTLADVAARDALDRLQGELLAGTQTRDGKPRSRFTVRTYMAVVFACLNWSCKKGWIESVPAIAKVKVKKLRHAKGRPLATEEFERMLDKTPDVVGVEASESWLYLLHGLWESALRLDELMHLSWDDANMIHPIWLRRREPVLHIPAERQKNDTEETIPVLPAFGSLMLQTPMDDRCGWVFRPKSLQTKLRRRARHGRPNTDWVGKVIARIGKAANVVVHPGDERSGRKPKFASAHDLRRSCAERLLDAEVPPTVIARILRHASWETTRRHYATGNVQKDAAKLRELLDGNRPYLGTIEGFEETQTT